MMAWRKSSYSSQQENCVEVAFTWRKSSYSSTENCVEVGLSWRTSSYTAQENCVQIAFPQDTVAIRDSKNTEGPMLTLPRPALSALVTTITG